MDSKEYYNIRGGVQDGDIFVYNGNGFMSKSIQYFDNAYYNHIGMVKKFGDRLFTIDMWTHGIEILPLSRRVGGYLNFCMVRPKNKTPEEINIALEQVLQLVDRDEKYDYGLLPRIALYKKTKINLGVLGSRDRFICSELAQFFTNKLDINCYKDIDMITPQDFIRHANEDEVQVLYDYSPKL